MNRKERIKLRIRRLRRIDRQIEATIKNVDKLEREIIEIQEKMRRLI